MDKTKKGFTIIELIVVIAVIGILSTIGVVSYVGTLKNSRDRQRESQAIVITEALEKYFDKNGLYPNCSQLSESYITTTLVGVDKQIFVTPKKPNFSFSLECFLNNPLENPSITNDRFVINYNNGGFQFKYLYEFGNSYKVITSRKKQEITSLNKTTISATSINSTQINIEWQPIDNVSSYEYGISINGSSFNPNSFTSNTYAQISSGLSAGTKYYFRVRGVLGATTSEWSNIATAITTPNKPTATAELSGTKLVLTMGESEFCSAGTTIQYTISNRTNNGNWSEYSNWITPTGNTINQYITPDNVTSYGFKAKARCFDSSGIYSPESEPSNETIYTRPVSVPSSPTIISNISDDETVFSVGLSGTIPTCAIGSVKYHIYTKVGNGDWSLVATSTYSANPIYTTTVAAGTAYGAKIYAFCYISDLIYSQDSAVSNEAFSISAPSAPNVTQTTSGSTTTWDWTDVTCLGSTASYQYRYSYDHYISTWTKTDPSFTDVWTPVISPTYIPLLSSGPVSFNTSNEGLLYKLEVIARCSIGTLYSKESSSNNATYHRAVNKPGAPIFNIATSGSGEFTSNKVNISFSPTCTGKSILQIKYDAKNGNNYHFIERPEIYGGWWEASYDKWLSFTNYDKFPDSRPYVVEIGWLEWRDGYIIQISNPSHNYIIGDGTGWGVKALLRCSAYGETVYREGNYIDQKVW